MDPSDLSNATTGASYAPPAPRDRGPVLVATDASGESDFAVDIGSVLGARLGAPVRVLSVVNALALPRGEADVFSDPSHAEAVRRAERLRRVSEQVQEVRKTIGAPAACETQIRSGSPARMIARVASECGARVIVVGLGRHRLLDRLPGHETALHLARLADVPVLAVPPGMTDLPGRAVVATDFSDFSRRAAHAALEVADYDAIVYLAHVLPRTGSVIPGWEGWSPASDRAASDALARLRAELPVGPERVVVPVVLRGDPAGALLAFAQNTGADLVAVGSHGYGFVQRLLVGSVATEVVRRAHCAVLVAPPAAR